MTKLPTKKRKPKAKPAKVKPTRVRLAKAKPARAKPTRVRLAKAKPASVKPAKVALDHAVWDLRLYIAGQTPKSAAALSNLKKICEQHLKGRYQIRVIDLLKQPQLAKDDQILAIPTLVRMLPAPMKKIIGSLSDAERVLVGFDLRPRIQNKPCGADWK